MKKLKYLIIMFLFFLSGCSFSSLDDGEGSEKNPYLIYTVEDFMDFGGRLYHIEDNYQGKYFKLMSDLNFFGVSYHPIGNNIFNSFEGNFDGNGYTLKNISIVDELTYSGVFGVIGKSGSVKNLNVENYYCKNEFVNGINGGIAGVLLYGASIDNCIVEGKIIANKESKNGVIGSGSYSGGIVGEAIGNVSNVKSYVDIEGYYVGGVIGKSLSRKVEYCYYENSKIISGYVAGSIVGSAVNDDVGYANYQNLYSKNIDITTNRIAGGAIGLIRGYFAFKRVFVETNIKVSGVNICYVGGLFGTGKENSSLSAVNFYFSKCYALFSIDIELLNVDSQAIVGFSGAYANSVYNTVCKGYINLKKGKIHIYTQTYVTSKFIVEEKNNVESFNKESGLFTKSSSKDNDIIIEMLKYNPLWVNVIDNYYLLKSEEEIFSNLEGKGSSDSPYLIHNFDELSYLYVSKEKKYFKLANNIDTFNKGNKDLDYIQNSYTYDLDGQNYSIINFDIGMTGGSFSSLFGEISNTSIRNVKYENIIMDIDDGLYTSFERGIFDKVYYSKIENVEFNFNVSFKDINFTFKLYELLWESELSDVTISGLFDTNKSVTFEVLYNQMTKSSLSNLNLNLRFKNSSELKLFLYGVISSEENLSSNKVYLYGENIGSFSNVFYHNVTKNKYSEDQLVCYYNDEKIYPEVV